MLQNFFIYALCILSFFFSFMVVSKKNPITSALNLLLVFVCFSGIYALIGAHLVSGFQILVYTGAILVLFVFVIMLIAPQKKDLQHMTSLMMDSSKSLLISGVAFIVSMIGMQSIILYWSFSDFAGDAADITWDRYDMSNAHWVSQSLFSHHVIPFEVTSIILLSVMVGVIAMAYKKDLASIRGKK